LHRGQLVRLSFELQRAADFVQLATTTPQFEHCGDAVYQGRGIVLRRYDRYDCPIAVIDAGAHRVYVPGRAPELLQPAAWISFRGTLLLDHYLWVEFLASYDDPPDLFYNLRVDRIRRVAVPERFIARAEKSASYPTSVDPSSFGEVEELDTM